MGVEQMLLKMQDGIAAGLRKSGVESPLTISTSASVSPSSTPEWWGVCPSYVDMVSPRTLNVPVEALRSMCGPFIEQMLKNVEEGVTSFLESADAGADATVDSPVPESGCTGAFGALLSIPSPEMNPHELFGFGLPMEPTFAGSVEVRRGCGQTWHQQSPTIVWADEEPETSVFLLREAATIPQKKLQICRHWQSKGFCRLGDGCKFLHPENVCGEQLINDSEESRSSRSRRSHNRGRGGVGAQGTNEWRQFNRQGSTSRA